MLLPVDTVSLRARMLRCLLIQYPCTCPFYLQAEAGWQPLGLLLSVSLGHNGGHEHLQRDKVR